MVTIVVVVCLSGPVGAWSVSLFPGLDVAAGVVAVAVTLVVGGGGLPLAGAGSAAAPPPPPWG